MKKFFNVSVDQGEQVTISYRSAGLVFEEGLRSGRWVALSWNASGSMMTANPLPEPAYMPWRQFSLPESFYLEIDSQALSSGWKFVECRSERDENSLTARVTLESEHRPVRVQVCTRLDGGPVMKRWLEIENFSAQPAAVGAYSALCGGLQVMPKVMDTLMFRMEDHKKIYRLGYFDDAGWACEGNFIWHELPENESAIVGRFGRERHRHPMCVVQNTVSGEYFIFQFAWSGGYRFKFDYACEADGVPRLWMRTEMNMPAPLIVLKPGEAWTGPAVHAGAVFGGLDAAINAMHAHVRALIWPKKPGLRELIEVGLGPEYDMSREGALRAVEYAYNLGAEVFFLDASWYAPPGCENEWHGYVGDWRPDARRYPGGLEEIREACHARGLKFGLWMEPERAGIRSKAFALHPEWRQTTFEGTPHPSGQLDLGIPECADYVRSEIRRVITEYQLDFYRIDWNVSAAGALGGRENSGYFENTAARYFDVLYDIFRGLRAEFPNVIFESCAGGGGRSDIGMTSLFTHTWVTDWQVHPNAFRITNGMTMALPPEHIDRLSFGQCGYVTSDLKTQLRNQLFSHMSLNVITPVGAKDNEPQLDAIRANVNLYKRFIRPILPECKIYHHTPELPGRYARGTGILEIASADSKRGVIGVFQLSEPDSSEIRVFPRGLKDATKYRVVMDNDGTSFEVFGWELSQRGLRVNLDGALTSELILFEDARDDALAELYPN